PEGSGGAFQPCTRGIIFLYVAECLLPLVSGSGLQDILLDLLQRRLAARLPNRTQVDVPRSNSAIVISGCLSVCASGCFQTVIRTRCSRMHVGDVPPVSAYLRDFPPDCRSVAHVWF